MSKTLIAVLTIVIAAALGALTGFLVRLSGQLERITVSVESLSGKANSMLDRTAEIEAKTSDAVDRFAADAVQRETDLQKAELQFYKTITDMKALVVDTNQSLNFELVPRLEKSLDASITLQNAAAASIVQTTANLNAQIDALRPMIDSGIRATSAAATAMGDPAIHETLAHVDGVSANLDATSGDIHAFVHRETTPVRGTWNVIKSFLRDFAGPAASVGTAIK